MAKAYGYVDAFAHVDAGDLNPGWATGTDDSLMLQTKTFGLELRYFGALDWSKSKNSHDFDVFSGDYADAYGKYKSWLNNGELNLHWWPCANDRYNLLMGFRWLRLGDRGTVYYRRRKC